MKKNRFTKLLLFFILLTAGIKAQIFNGDLTLDNQAEVDSFNYTEVNGYLNIKGPDITNLDGLSELQEISTYLYIDNNPMLTNIDGLSNLDSIKGGFSLREQGTTIKLNPMLTNLDGLSNLKYILWLNILENQSLQNIDGLTGVTHLDALGIVGNPSLTNINGLSNVTNIRLPVQSIRNNSSLTEFCGLYTFLNSGNVVILEISGNGANPSYEDIIKQGPCFPMEFTGDIILTSQAEVYDFNYTTVTGNVTVEGADIKNIDGLLELDSVGGSFVIRNNNNLNDIYGIRYLQAVGGDLSITSNPLISILLNSDQFHFLGGNLTIQNNTNLDEFCGLYSLFAAGYSGSVNISGNKSNPSRDFIENNGACSDILYFGELILSTQAQIDSFSYKKIIGGLVIAESSPGNITNINGLSELTSAYFLRILNSSLSNLAGLENLSSLGGLNIANNPNLANIDALTSLTLLDGLNISENKTLENIDGLSNLTKVTTTASIQDNDALKNIDGFSGISSFNNISVASNHSLQNINGLANVDSIMDDIDIRDLPLITNIDPLSNLSYVRGDLRIQVTGIQNVNALQKLRYVGRLFLLVNSRLSEYCGLYPLLTEGFIGQYSVGSNLVNPSMQHIIDNGPCGQSSDSIFVGNLFLTSQSQIDTFSYNVVTGHLCVAEQHDGNITNINGLSKLKSVGILFIIENDSLKNLDSLYNLTSAFTIEIKNNSSLTEFCGLYNLIKADGISSSQPIISGNAVNPTIAEIEAGGPCTEPGSDGSLTDVGRPNIPTEYNLSQNHPNPFNPSTIIKYALPEAQFVKLNVYNSLGELVRTLVNENLNAGEYETVFDASALPSGMYIYRIEAGSFTRTNKMILIR